MPFWYFLTVPTLPVQISHQSNTVEIAKYLVKESSAIDVGTPIAIVENYWALMTVRAKGKGIFRKKIFDPGTTVKIGDPIAVVGADGENVVHGNETLSVEVTEIKRQKPATGGKSTSS
jgi:pyruvate dehydrogenase E2 component (dihydrolipoamide acetyltransferase)